jgi:hypothetical protein
VRTGFTPISGNGLAYMRSDRSVERHFQPVGRGGEQGWDCKYETMFGAQAPLARITAARAIELNDANDGRQHQDVSEKL